MGETITRCPFGWGSLLFFDPSKTEKDGGGGRGSQHSKKREVPFLKKKAQVCGIYILAIRHGVYI